MKSKVFGKTGRAVSEIGLGTWQLGTVWGQPFNDAEAERILEAAYESGVTFIDTADNYNGGMSEKAIGKFLKKHPDHFYVTTKCGKRLKPFTPEMFTPEVIEEFVDSSLTNLGLEKLDMILLHCPPSPVYRRDDIFGKLEALKKSGKLAGYGVSIQKMTDGIAAMDYDIDAIEVIYNMFRLKPEDELFPMTLKKNIAVIARIPLASGLLTGRYTKDTTFGEKDHRSYNRDGSHFDKGETFSGVPFELGIDAAEELKKLFGTEDLIPYALRWVLMNPAVNVVIPGASKVSQVYSNVRAAEYPPLTPEQMAGVKAVYDKYLRAEIHPQW